MSENLFNPYKPIICAVICYSLITFGVVSVSAQTLPSRNTAPSSAQLDSSAQEIKNQVVNIGQNNDITIIGKNKREFYGSILEIKNESVSINEIDQRAIVEIKYEDIKKVRKGYGSAKNRFGNRIPNKRRIIFTAAITGLILLPIIILANSKD